MSYISISVPVNAFSEDEISTLLVHYLNNEEQIKGLVHTIVREAQNEEAEIALRKFAEAIIVRLIEIS